jgi:hypothetical protein
MKNNYCTVCGEVKTVIIKKRIWSKPISVDANKLPQFTVSKILRVYCSACGVMYDSNSIGK